MQIEQEPGFDVSRALEFIAQNKGIVLKSWAATPTRHPDCRAVFPASTKRPFLNGVSSPFVRSAIDAFYPHVIAYRVGSHFLQVKLSMSSKSVLTLLESDFELKSRSGLLTDTDKKEYPSYRSALMTSAKTTFMGVDGVLVQMVPSQVQSLEAA